MEATYRDWHHPWAVRAAVGDLPTEARVARLIGGVLLGLYSAEAPRPARAWGQPFNAIPAALMPIFHFMELGGPAMGRRGAETRGVTRAVEAFLSLALPRTECLETAPTQR
jgi:hypothetical protein